MERTRNYIDKTSNIERERREKLEKLLEEILHESEPKEELLDARVQQLWERVDNTLSRQEERRQEQRRRKLRRRVSWAVAAAAVVLLAFVGLQQMLHRDALPGMNIDHAKQLLLSHQGDTGDQILLITGEDSINVEGDFAEIEHRGGEQIASTKSWLKKKRGRGTVELLRLIVPKEASFVRSDGSTPSEPGWLFYPAVFKGEAGDLWTTKFMAILRSGKSFQCIPKGWRIVLGWT